MRTLLRRLAMALAGLLALAALASPAAEAPAVLPDIAAEVPADRYTVHDLDWLDAARGRPVPVRLYLPRAAGAAAAPVPLVVFSHGIGGSRAGYSYLGRYWASQGYASLHLQHVGSDRRLWTGNLLAIFSRLQDAATEAEALARVGDLRFALDQLLGSELGRAVDASRIVAAGHSYGANTTLLAAGAKVHRDGRPLELRDPRIRAAIVISAPPFYGEGDPATILSGVTVPTLHVTATDDVIRIPGYYSGADDRIAVFEATGSARKTLAVFAGGSHSMFTDRRGTGGAELNPQVKAATRALSLAFLREVFAGEVSAIADWPRRHAAIVARFVRAGP